MKQEIIILANRNTNERIAVVIDPTDNIMTKGLNDKFGGNWVKVGELSPGDMLKFTSDDIYLGFDNREDDNYCKGALIKLSKTRNIMPEEKNTQTIGEQRVRTSFNPSQTHTVDLIKQKSAELINLCEELKAKDGRLASLAQTSYEEAAMWAVKAATS